MPRARMHNMDVQKCKRRRVDGGGGRGRPFPGTGGEGEETRNSSGGTTGGWSRDSKEGDSRQG